MELNAILCVVQTEHYLVDLLKTMSITNKTKPVARSGSVHPYFLVIYRMRKIMLLTDVVTLKGELKVH